MVDEVDPTILIMKAQKRIIEAQLKAAIDPSLAVTKLNVAWNLLQGAILLLMEGRVLTEIDEPQHDWHELEELSETEDKS